MPVVTRKQSKLDNSQNKPKLEIIMWLLETLTEELTHINQLNELYNKKYTNTINSNKLRRKMYFNILCLETEMYRKINLYIDNIISYIHHEQVKRLIQAMYNKINVLKTDIHNSEFQAVTEEEMNIVNLLVYELTESHRILFHCLYKFVQPNIEEMLSMVF
jgi:hypothetical protein